MHKKQIRPLARLHGYWLHRTTLARMGRWPADTRRQWVLQRLRQSLQLAADGTEFYRQRFREAGFDPTRHFQSIHDITRVPVLTKEDVRSHWPKMIDRRFYRGSVEANTSGTTGQPMTLRLNEYYVAFDYACMFRHWAKAGYRFRDRYAALRSYVPDHPGGSLWKYNRWQRTLYLSAYHLKPSNADRYIDALLRFRPLYLRGYVSSIHLLAEFAHPRRHELNFIRGIFTASETLTDHERAAIERTFGRILWDWYGMTEPAVVITERADHDGLEVNWEYGFPEFVSDDPHAALAPDERRLLATSLHNPVMPFIRYDTRDIARLDSRWDEAGLYPRVRAMRGRKDECLLTPDGGRLPSLNFYSLLQTYTEILRFQFVQAGAGPVSLKLSLRPGTADPGDLVRRVESEVRRRLGPDLKLTVELTDQFLTSPDGKTPTFKRLPAPETRLGDSSPLP
jgi:phenylacetate-coenzyme A ligase PaaK-like adenylate-forming protein